MEVGHEDGLAKTSMGQFFTAVLGSSFFWQHFLAELGFPKALAPTWVLAWGGGAQPHVEAAACVEGRCRALWM